MQSAFVPFKDSAIHYITIGAGEKILVCLHGFAENAESFFPLAEHLTNKYTIVLPDMPLHGKTTWKQDLLFTIDDLAEIINKIPVIENKNFAVLGYSMGGRIALQLYQCMPKRIEKLILIAPDGIIINPWYGLATQTKAGNALFYRVMKKPGVFFAATTALKKLSLINTGVYKYVHQHLKTNDMRSRLYNIWTTMRKMKPDIQTIKKLIITCKTPVLLVYGRYDKVIRYTTGEKFRTGIEALCALHILNCGHRLLHEKNVEEIAGKL
ncbi:MAG: alpha/beta hydrolase [Chitinophagaceae bacterium]|nr:alpha/beta hydrolase [Chitinophagaceae bacterium]